MSVIATAAVALALAGPAQDPFAELGTCAGNKPGPEPQRTVLQLCVPRLVRAWLDNGLVAVPEARRLQPIPVGRLSFNGQTGAPPKILLNGGVRLLSGLRLRNRDRVTITTRIDVVSWDGRTRYARSGHRTLRLHSDTRISVRGHTVIELVSATRGTVRIPLRRSSTAEDAKHAR